MAALDDFGAFGGRALILRNGRDDDAAGFIRLVGSCWAEYPGCVMDLDGEVPELRGLASYYAACGGRLWAAEHDSKVVGMVATRPGPEGVWELCKMYVAAEQRGTGTAAQLFAEAEAHARAMGAQALDLWTDTRFDRAHRFYERCGLVRYGAMRALEDKSNSIEYHYAKPLTGLVVRVLDTAAASSAARALGRVLQACVNSGASVSFLPPLSLPEAEGFYRGKTADVAAGRRIVLAAWADGVLAGSAMVNIDMVPNQLHRADLQKMLVLPEARRRGVARALLQAAEDEATAAGRWLLVLDTREGDNAEPLYQSCGWIRAGKVPDFARNPDGSFSATVLYYKRLNTIG